VKRRSVHLRESQADAIEEIRRESAAREDVPEINESEVIRKIVAVGLEHSELGTLVDENTRIRLQREEYIANEGHINNLRNGFRAKVAEQFRDKFKSGWNKSELAGFAENMKEDARMLWPEWSEEDYSEERQRAPDYVDAVVREAKKAAETSDREPLKPENVFRKFEGVEEGQARQTAENVRDTDLFDRLVADAIERIEATVTTRSDDAITDALAAQYNIEQSVAESAVREARERTGGASA